MNSAGRRVAITGISSHWGGELARQLERDPRVDYIAGIDTPPAAGRARAHGVHRGRRPQPGPLAAPAGDGGRHGRPLRDPLVPGARAAGAGPARDQRDRDAPAARRLRAAPTTLRTRDRPRLGGDLRLRGRGRRRSSPRTCARAEPLRTRFQRDISELEEYFDNFARRHPELVCCMLRYQPEIGAGLDSPLVRYLTLPVVPVQLGFDPRLQLLARRRRDRGARRRGREPGSRRRSTSRPRGSISLSRTLRLLRPAGGADPAPAVRAGARPARRRARRRRRSYGDGVRLLRYGRGVDNSRLRAELGYEPRLRRGRRGPRPGRQDARAPRIRPEPPPRRASPAG